MQPQAIPDTIYGQIDMTATANGTSNKEKLRRKHYPHNVKQIANI
nr:hypothetical protein [Pseudovibrio stylochi]